MIVLLVASRSKASAVIPTVVPTITFSVTSSVAPSTSVGTVTSNSSTSLIVMLNDWLATDPSLLAAWTVIERVAPCVSRSIAAAVVTTPVLASIVNSPSGLLVRL